MVKMNRQEQKERRRQKFKDGMQKIRNKHKARKKKAYAKMTPPRYDEVYEEGVKWLNSLD